MLTALRVVLFIVILNLGYWSVSSVAIAGAWSDFVSGLTLADVVLLILAFLVLVVAYFILFVAYEDIEDADDRRF